MSRFSRRQFLIGSAAAPLFAQKESAPRERPNIVLIMADDLAAWMCGVFGNQEIRTPNIDTLARLGVRFPNTFVTTPAGSASRATLFTGRTPMQHGIQDFLTGSPVADPPQGQQAPPPSFAGEVMIPDVLAGAGYQCGYVGKWAMGNDENPGHKFSYAYTMPTGAGKYQNPTMSRNGKLVEEKGYLGDLLTGAASEFLDQQNPGQPFFLTLSYLNPHQPYDGHPQKYYDMYAKTSFDTVGWERLAENALRDKELLGDTVGNLRKCAAGVTALDDQIPVLLKKLRERKLWTNTLIVFVGDNGQLLGRHGLWGAGLASNPINMYEEVVQVPLIMSWPGEIPIEASRPDMVGFYDILPTLCEAAQAPLPEGRNLCGGSFLTQARGHRLPKDAPAWAETVFGHYRNTRMARDNRFKLVIRNNGDGPNELFNLRSDPRERRNEYDDLMYVTVRDRLRGELDEWEEKYSA